MLRGRRPCGPNRWGRGWQAACIRWAAMKRLAATLVLGIFGLGALTVAFLLFGPGMAPWADTLLTACFGWNAETRHYRLDALILTLLQPPLFAAVVYFFASNFPIGPWWWYLTLGAAYGLFPLLGVVAFFASVALLLRFTRYGLRPLLGFRYGGDTIPRAH